MEGFFQRYLSLYRTIITSLNELMRPYELSYSLWQVIFYIKNYGPSTLVEIAHRYQVEKPTITRRVQRLESLLLVKHIPGVDRREKVIELTELGEEIYRECRKKITALEKKLMEGISKEEQMVAFQILPKIQDNLIIREDKTSE